ncbi:MAG: hypothetical protein FWB86_03705 [Treponema sp.]|nr:hypothetical protein [Treponema sp.]MCL2250438.1 hypothetical protein [Treponema sp.]
MKNNRIFIISLIILIAVSATAFSDDLDLPIPTSLEDLKNAASDFSSNIAQALPFNSTMGLNWSDAYIGQLFGVPPRFGVGLTVGATFIPIVDMNELLDMFNIKLPIEISLGLPLPSYTVEGRIGGIILPFDLGVKVGWIPSFDLPYVDVGLKYLLFGVDLRYSLLPKNIPIVKLSVGLGYNYLTGGLSKSIPAGGLPSFEFSDPDLGIDYSLDIADPTIYLDWNTHCFEVKAQASFSLLIITPYAGIGFSYAKSEAGYRAKTDVTVNGGAVELDDVMDLLQDTFGLENLSPNGFGAMKSAENYNLRAYGGISFNLTKVRIDLTLMYNFFSKSLGGTIGTRFQM